MLPCVYTTNMIPCRDAKIKYLNRVSITVSWKPVQWEGNIFCKHCKPPFWVPHPQINACMFFYSCQKTLKKHTPAIWGLSPNCFSFHICSPNSVRSTYLLTRPSSWYDPGSINLPVAQSHPSYSVLASESVITTPCIKNSFCKRLHNHINLTFKAHKLFIVSPFPWLNTPADP